MTPFTALISLLVIGLAVEAFIVAAIIYHLRKYTLPGWTVARTVVATYLTLSVILLGMAIYWLLRVPETFRIST